MSQVKLRRDELCKFKPPARSISISRLDRSPTKRALSIPFCNYIIKYDLVQGLAMININDRFPDSVSYTKTVAAVDEDFPFSKYLVICVNGLFLAISSFYEVIVSYVYIRGTEIISHESSQVEMRRGESSREESSRVESSRVEVSRVESSRD